MTTVLKKEWTIGFWIILVMFITMGITTIGGVHPIFIPILGTLQLFFYLFQTDEKSKMNIHVASLPIAKKTIVQGRYLFIGLFMLGIVLSGYFSNQLTLILTPDWEGYTPISFKQGLAILIIILLLCSLLLPIFYSLRYNIAGLFYLLFALPPIAVFFASGHSFLSILNKNIFIVNYAPILFCFSIFAYWLSCQLSTKIFERKDLRT